MKAFTRWQTIMFAMFQNDFPFYLPTGESHFETINPNNLRVYLVLSLVVLMHVEFNFESLTPQENVPE